MTVNYTTVIELLQVLRVINLITFKNPLSINPILLNDETFTIFFKILYIFLTNIYLILERIIISYRQFMLYCV